MIRTQLDDATRERLHALRREALPPKVRDRIEMVTLSDAGWSPPRIAEHLGYCGQTVRDRLRDFLARGTDALYPHRTGPAPDAAHRDRVARELSASLGKRFANYPCDVRVHLITGSSRQRACAALDDARGRRWIAGRREFDDHEGPASISIAATSRLDLNQPTAGLSSLRPSAKHPRASSSGMKREPILDLLK